jgi:hypothetical protein
MTRARSPEPRVQVVTANLLREGHVVWLTADEGWTRDLARARPFDDTAAAEAALTRAATRTGEVVGAYITPMRPTPNGPAPGPLPRSLPPRRPLEPRTPPSNRLNRTVTMYRYDDFDRAFLRANATASSAPRWSGVCPAR